MSPANLPRYLLPGALLLLAPAATVRIAPRSYDVQFAYVGYLSEYNPLPSICAQLNPQGYDSLVGTLSGNENPPGSDDDVVYTGRARRATRIDYCLTKPKNPAAPDELTYCTVRLVGGATMDLQLTIYSDSGKGAWLKATPVGNANSVSVTGDCTAQDINQIRSDYPNGTSAASPDGQPIFESGSEFTERGIRRLQVRSFPAKPPETAWGLRVLRAIP